MAKSARRRGRFYDDDVGHEGYVRTMQREHWDENLRRYLREFNGFSLWDYEDELRQLHVPTLVVAAGADLVVGARGLERLVATMPNAKLVRMHDCSHMMFEDRPDEIVAHVKEWAMNTLDLR